MGFKTINGKKVFIDNNQRRSGSGRNDQSEGMKIGSGTRVPEGRDPKNFADMSEEEQRLSKIEMDDLRNKVNELGQEFPEPEELEEAGVNPSDSAKVALKKLIDEGIVDEPAKIEIENIDLRELRDHPSFQESEDWLDVFANTPEVNVYDELRDIFYIWFGGESHTVHLYSTDGKEFDVFTFGFEKNKLTVKEVMEVTERHLNDRSDLVDQ